MTDPFGVSNMIEPRYRNPIAPAPVNDAIVGRIVIANICHRGKTHRVVPAAPVVDSSPFLRRSNVSHTSALILFYISKAS